MPYCLKCSALPCGEDTGLISMGFSMNSSIRPIDEACSEENPDIPFLPGPSTANITLTHYAFKQGEDKWLGSRCKAQASASQTNVLKYDYLTNKYWYIPTKVHKAQIAGDFGDKVFLDKVFYKGVNVESQATAGMTIASQLEVWLGAGFNYNGSPMPVHLPDLSPYTIKVGEVEKFGYINAMSVSTEYPNTPAVVTYSFEFMLEKEE